MNNNSNNNNKTMMMKAITLSALMSMSLTEAFTPSSNIHAPTPAATKLKYLCPPHSTSSSSSSSSSPMLTTTTTTSTTATMLTTTVPKHHSRKTSALCSSSYDTDDTDDDYESTPSSSSSSSSSTTSSTTYLTTLNGETTSIPNSRFSQLLEKVELDLPSLEYLPKKRMVSSSNVFCNRELNLSGIKAIGFDMDYTLAQYHQPAFDKLAFDGAKEKLVYNFGYPKELLDIEYDHSFWVRGLIIDTQRGNFLKIDRHKYVRVA